MEPQIFTTASKQCSFVGLSTLPVDKNKRPLVGWEFLQKRLPTHQEIDSWSQKRGLSGVAVVAGGISGNIQALDIDCKYDLTGTLWDGFCALVEEHSLELFQRLVIAKTINGGFHVIVRIPSELTQGNQKLAGRPTTEDERRQTYEKEIASGADETIAQRRAENDKIRVLVETRGEGGYFVVQPTPGYEFIQGNISSIPAITKGEYELLLAIARSFDEMPVQEEPQHAKAETKKQNDGLSPFEDYNDRADVPALLEQHGMKFICRRDGRLHYLRPGQTDSKTSANYHEGNRVFYVFSTSTVFEAGKGYNPTGVYTQLVHNGDYSAASRALYEAGYGTRRAAKTTTNNVADEKEVERQQELSKLPVLSNTALYGLAGEVVRTIEPHTEADNTALLVQLLAAFGNVIGKTAYFKVESSLHFTKIFAVLIGMSSKGRKGTSWERINQLMISADESFVNCVQDGLSSGEGLIHHVRDPQEKEVPIKEKGRITGYQTETVDSGATEKRAFIVEPEFARVLRAMQREGSTLSAVIRQAWDGDRLRVMTKNPLRATNTHISIVGHITQDELRRNLEETETANGFANRFLFVFTRRSKFLPEGGNLSQIALNGLVTKLNKAINFAREVTEIRRDEAARQLWIEVYGKLSSGNGGLFGSVTSRAEAQVMRLACLYALLDLSSVIRREHLQAALAFWQYCEDSARYVFGETTGDKVADEILNALQANPDEGLTRVQIHKLFSNNRSASQIKAALQSLLESGRIEQIEGHKTGGRPSEIFRGLHYERNERNEVTPDTNEASDADPFGNAESHSGEREVFEF